MEVRGECSPTGELPPQPVFEEGFTAKAVGPEVSGFKDPRLAEGPGRARERGGGVASTWDSGSGSPWERRNVTWRRRRGLWVQGKEGLLCGWRGS